MSAREPQNPEVPSWDEDSAAALVGKKVLLGITVLDHDENEIERHQMHGTVRSASRDGGIEIALEGVRQGETYRLPPATGSFHPAKPGEYRLRQTGEVVVNPDYTSVWTITRPQHPPSP